MIATSGSSTEKHRIYSMLYYWDDAADTGTASEFIEDEWSSTATTYLQPFQPIDDIEFFITAKELNRIEAQKVLNQKTVDIPALDFKPNILSLKGGDWAMMETSGFVIRH